MNTEGNLTAKQNKINFHFNQQTSSYQSKLTLSNQAQQPQYFHIVSTFGKLLTYQNHGCKKIQPFKSTILNLKLKIPNQIKKHEQKVKVSFSRKQISSKIKLADDHYFDVMVEFEEMIPEQDQMITQILKADCQQLCNQAGQLLKNGFIKKALYKYQESFMLYRQVGNGLYGMAQCFYLMQCWYEALQEIETVLILHNDQNYLWLRLKIIFQIIKDQPNSIQVLKGLKKEIQKIVTVQNVQEKKKQMIQYLIKEENKISSQKGGKYVAEFIETTFNKYEEDNNLKTLYPNFKDFEKQVLELLGIKKAHTLQQAPQYILDPITYQIMNNPVIVPSGHSFEQRSLIAYISKHGNKDLYTRQQLRYQWARPNTSLQNYIKKSQHLKQWIEYQKQITAFK